MKKKRTICVDFDGVIHSYTSPWVNAHTIPDEPVPGAITWLFSMLRHFRVVIFSTRCKTWRGRRAMGAWLRKHAGELVWYETPDGPGLEDVEFSYTKEPGLIYLDDRGVRFEGPGTFPSKKDIYQLIPWNKR